MNHLLRDVAPITEQGWSELDSSGPRAAGARARRPQGRRLLRPARLGLLRHQPRPHRAADRRRGRPGRAPRRAAAGRAARRLRVVARPSWPIWSAAPRTSTSSRWRRPPAGWPSPRTPRSSTAGRPPASAASPRPACTTPIALSGDFNAYSGHTAEAVETLLRNGIMGPYALALGPDQYTGVIQTAEHGGVLLFDHLKKILQGGPIVWAPGVTGAVVVSLRGGDFLFESGQDLVDRLLAPRRRRPSTSTSRSPSPSAWRRRRPLAL